MITCLFNRDNLFSYEEYIENISPYEIYKQENDITDNRVFILSAFPEFILDHQGYKLYKKYQNMNRDIEKKNECDNLIRD